MQFFGSQEHLQRTRSADQARQALRASPSGDEPEGRAAMSEDCVRPGNSVPAGKRQVETSAHAVAVNRGNRWGREVGHGLHQPLAHQCEAKGVGAVQSSDFAQIGAGGEEVTVAGEHEPGGILLSQIADCRSQCDDPRLRQTVGTVGGD